jgi:hypothetical protein
MESKHLSIILSFCAGLLVMAIISQFTSLFTTEANIILYNVLSDSDKSLNNESLMYISKDLSVSYLNKISNLPTKDHLLDIKRKYSELVEKL